MNIYRVYVEAKSPKKTIDDGWILPASSPKSAAGRGLRKSKVPSTATGVQVTCLLLYKNMTWAQYKERNP